MWQAVEMKGKGENDRGRIGRAGGRNGLQGRYCLLRFLRPPDERKNPDWSDFMNYPMRHSNWPATCHSRELVFSDSFIQYAGQLT